MRLLKTKVVMIHMMTIIDRRVSYNYKLYDLENWGRKKSIIAFSKLILILHANKNGID